MLKPEWIPSAYQDAAKQHAVGNTAAAQQKTRLVNHSPGSKREPLIKPSAGKKR